MKTIKQLADEIGVSKQAVRKQVDKLPPTCISTGENRSILINDDGVRIIRDQMSARQPTVDTNKIPTVDTVVDTLIKQLEVKDQQITALQQSLNDTTKALHEAQQTAKAAQMLHAGTIRQQLTEGAEQSEADTLGPADLVGPEHSTKEQPEKRRGIFARIFGNK